MNGFKTIVLGSLELIDDKESGFVASDYEIVFVPGVPCEIVAKEITLVDTESEVFKIYDGTDIVGGSPVFVSGDIAEADRETVKIVLAGDLRYDDGGAGENKVLRGTFFPEGNEHGNYVLDESPAVQIRGER